MKIRRYEIYLADLNPTLGAEMSKTRPVVVVSDDDMNSVLQTIVICPVTSSLHPAWRSRVQITCAGKRAEIAVDQIRAITKDRCLKKVDVLAPLAAKEVRLLITEMYGE